MLWSRTLLGGDHDVSVDFRLEASSSKGVRVALLTTFGSAGRTGLGPGEFTGHVARVNDFADFGPLSFAPTAATEGTLRQTRAGSIVRWSCSDASTGGAFVLIGVHPSAGVDPTGSCLAAGSHDAVLSGDAVTISFDDLVVEAEDIEVGGVATGVHETLEALDLSCFAGPTARVASARRRSMELTRSYAA